MAGERVVTRTSSRMASRALALDSGVITLSASREAEATVDSALPAQISNRQLRAAFVPSSTDPWDVIGRFALTFATFVNWDDISRCQEAAQPGRTATLTELRTALFSEQRAWRHQGVDPPPQAMVYIRWVVDEIRAKFGGTGAGSRPAG